MIGRRYGKLTVEAEASRHVYPNGKTAKRYLCVCDCGNKKVINSTSLYSGGAKTCGCRNAVKMIGARFGKLTVAGEADPYINPKAGTKIRSWKCTCDCGVSVVVRGDCLRNGNTNSCGCEKWPTKHGQCKSKTYETWMNMQRRCRNGKLKNYGARGVQVCERWQTFENFLADMGERPDGCSIDRIDSRKGYSPANCRWATRVQQNRNTSRNRFIEHQGRRMCMSEAAALAGMPRNRLKWRLDNGWSIEKAMSA